MTNREFLNWLYNRLHYVYNEPYSKDYMIKLKELIDSDDWKYSDLDGVPFEG